MYIKVCPRTEPEKKRQILSEIVGGGVEGFCTPAEKPSINYHEFHVSPGWFMMARAGIASKPALALPMLRTGKTASQHAKHPAMPNFSGGITHAYFML